MTRETTSWEITRSDPPTQTEVVPADLRLDAGLALEKVYDDFTLELELALPNSLGLHHDTPDNGA